MVVNALKNRAEYDAAVSIADRLVVVEVVATWCGPCNDIAPTVKELSERYSDVVFNEVDVDVAPDVVQELGVRGPPTFVFFKNTQRVNELFRPSPVVLEDMVLKYRG